MDLGAKAVIICRRLQSGAYEDVAKVYTSGDGILRIETLVPNLYIGFTPSSTGYNWCAQHHTYENHYEIVFNGEIV